MNQSVIVQPSQKWREENGIIRRTVSFIHLSAIADGTTGPLWIPRLREKGCRLNSDAERILSSSNFSLSRTGIIEIAILRGDLFQHKDRVVCPIRAMAIDLKFTKPETDVGCILREMLSTKDIEDMGLQRIMMMHEPFDCDGNPYILGVDRGDACDLLGAYYGDPAHGWDPDYGFAFVVSRE